MASESISAPSPQPYYKPSAAAAGPQPCEVCGGKVHELRRGRCFSCYQRWAEMRPVGYGARCVCCGERRRQVLRMVEFHSTWRSMCFNCAGQMYALIATPDTIEGLRKALRRERRRVERRADRTDTRVFRFERRVGERRDVLGDAMELLDDDLIIEVVPDLDVELGDDGDMDGEEHTRIHQNLAQLAEGLAQGSATALPAVDRFSADGNPAAHLGRMSRVARAERAEPESRQPYEPTIIVSVQ